MEEQVPCWFSCRLVLVVLGLFGFINVYTLRVNMSVAIVCMVNQTAIKDTEVTSATANTSHHAVQCASHIGNETDTEVYGEFAWDRKVQGYILSSFYWGYFFTQVLGGWLSTEYGGQRVFAWCMLICSIATFLTPLAAETSYIFLIFLRIVTGLASGPFFPAMHSLLGRWAPPLERSKMAAVIYAGSLLGVTATFPLSGYLCKYGFAGGWPSIFYVLGICSAVWLILWVCFTSDSPESHRRITKSELKYIQDSLKESLHSETKMKKIPWRRILTSMPVLAIVVANMSCDWGGVTLLTSIPTYISDILQFDIGSNGFYSALPYLAFWMVINLSGIAADTLQEKKYLTTTTTRKLMDFFGKIIPAILLIAVGYMDCHQYGTVIILLVFAVGMSGTQYSGFLVNHVDIAPPFAGILIGITNSFGGIISFIAPMIMGYITDEGQGREQWLIVFYISAGVYVFGAVFYVIFASGELQDWAKEDGPEHERLNVENGREMTRFDGPDKQTDCMRV